ncbi:hypothetical protein K9M47_03165 [Candidatus Gracilibacteria bacterium]|nr:hypothetical protein [Candidatus Gracilibacteria bacterium]
MNKEKLDEFNQKITELCKEYNCTLQVAQTIQIVPNKEEAPVEEKKEDEQKSDN